MAELGALYGIFAGGGGRVIWRTTKDFVHLFEKHPILSPPYD